MVQNITAPHGSTRPEDQLILSSHQEFEVYGPRFALPANSLHQIYPPQGHSDHSVVLPHIVFNDPHLPWEQIGSRRESETIPAANGVPPRNKTPWLALLTFTEDELRLNDKELGRVATGGLFPDKWEPLELKQSKTTMSITLPQRKILDLDTWIRGSPRSSQNIVTAVRDDDPDNPIIPKPESNSASESETEPTADMIFLPPDLFHSLFCDYDANYNKVFPDDNVPILDRYKYLAHVRQLNTRHMSSVGVDDEQGLFSAVISHRCGPTNGTRRQIIVSDPKATPPSGPSFRESPPIALPKSTIVHLVSLQGVEDYIRIPTLSSRVGLVSLFSWTYTTIPPENINFVDAMRSMGSQIPQPLRAPPVVIGKVKAADKDDPSQAASGKLQQRLTDGYSMVRYLTETGESTAAFFRGPLTPNLPPHPLNKEWPLQTNFSSALQILDSSLGIMDITYSSAWELGRTLAIADRSYTAAIARVRAVVSTQAVNEAKKESTGLEPTRAAVVSGLQTAVNLINDISRGLTDGTRTINPAKRWKSNTATLKTASLAQDANRLFDSHVHAAMDKIASAVPTAHAASGTQRQHFNEANIPSSPDWATMVKWVVDKLYLYGIPAHYLITEQSHLPPESIRFFYIDPNWTDAFIDGALSIASQVDEPHDPVRQVMKIQLNNYFASVDKTLLPHPQQIPTYGFFMRSAVVQAFPNLQIHAPWTKDGDGKLEVVRQDVLGKDLLLCLLDRIPGDQSLSSLTISQPPHQQRFAAGVNLGVEEKAGSDPHEGLKDKTNFLEIEFNRVYTVDNVADPNFGDPIDIRLWGEGQGEIPITRQTKAGPVSNKLPIENPPVVFDWENNTLVIKAFAPMCNNVLTQELPNMFTDREPSAALVGIQLNDPISKMKIVMNPRVDGKDNSEPCRKIYVSQVPPSTAKAPPNIGNITAASATVRVPFQAPITMLPSAKVLTASKAGASSPGTKQYLTSASNPHAAPAKPATHPAGPIGRTSGDPHPGGFTNGFISTCFTSGTANLSDNNVLLIHPKGSSEDLPIDLVFRFQRNPHADLTLQIYKVTIQIPRGSADTDLLESYSGTSTGGPARARMLSNPRFNTLVSDNGSSKLEVALWPRSTTQLCPLADNPSLDFILNQVRINRMPGTVRCNVYEWYRSPGAGTDASKWPIVAEGNSYFKLIKKKAA